MCLLVWVSAFVLQGVSLGCLGLRSVSVGLSFTPSGCKAGSLARDSGLGLGVCASGCKVGSLARGSGPGLGK